AQPGPSDSGRKRASERAFSWIQVMPLLEGAISSNAGRAVGAANWPNARRPSASAAADCKIARREMRMLALRSRVERRIVVRPRRSTRLPALVALEILHHVRGAWGIRATRGGKRVALPGHGFVVSPELGQRHRHRFAEADRLLLREQL